MRRAPRETCPGARSIAKESKPSRLLAAAPAPQVDMEADGGEVAPEGPEDREILVSAAPGNVARNGHLAEGNALGGGDAEVVRQEHLGLGLARDAPLRD